MKIKKFFVHFILLTVFLAFQNCSQYDPNGVAHPNESPSSGNLNNNPFANGMSGNGGGYTGIELKSDAYVVPGESSRVNIVGGQPPYRLTASSADVSISPSNSSDEFFIKLDSHSEIKSFTLLAMDSQGQRTSKNIWVHVLPVPELETPDGVAGDLGRCLAINGKISVICGSGNNIAGLFTFSVENNVVTRTGDLLSDKDVALTLDLSETYLLTGNEQRHSAGIELTGSVSLYDVTSGQAEMIDFIVSPNLKYQDFFGHSVSLNNHQFAVGSPRYSTPKGAIAGSVYVYEVENKKSVLKQVINAPQDKNIYKFGGDVKLTDDHLFVTSLYGSNNSLFAPWLIHIYKNINGNWEPQQIISLSNETNYNLQNCNGGLAASNNHLFISCQAQLTGEYEYEKQNLIISLTEENGSWSNFKTIRPTQNDPGQSSKWAGVGPSQYSANNDLLAVGYTKEGHKGVEVYKYDPQLREYTLWKVADLTDEYTGVFTKIDLHNQQILVRGNTVYENFSLMLELDKLPLVTEE